MQNLSDEILPILKSHKIEGINAGNDSLLPNYNGFSLVNIPGTICKLLDIAPFGAASLSDDILRHLNGPYENIVFILIDGLRYNFFQEFFQTPLWQSQTDNALFTPITSISPSTTSTALTSLWTGRHPAEHGILGYEVWLKEYGMIANMINHSAFTFQGDNGGLQRAGFDPSTFLPVETLGPHMRKNKVKPSALQNISIAYSGLSKMLFPSVNIIPYRSNIDLFVSLENLLREEQIEKTYTYIYWETIDTLSHRFGPDDERIIREFEHFSQALIDSIERIKRSNHSKTLLIISADHGFVHTPIDSRYDLTRYADINKLLVMVPTGENRLPYLFPKNGCSEQLLKLLQLHFGDDFIAIPSKIAIDKGLFGRGDYHPMLAERLGEWVVIPQNNAYLWWWWQKENPLLGRHGGLSPEEMLIPFFALEL